MTETEPPKYLKQISYWELTLNKPTWALIIQANQTGIINADFHFG